MVVIVNWYKVSVHVVNYNKVPSLFKINNLAIHEHTFTSMIYLTQRERVAPLASVSEAHRHR